MEWRLVWIALAIHYTCAVMNTRTKSCVYGAREKTMTCTSVNLSFLKAYQYPVNITELDHLYLTNTSLKKLDHDVFHGTQGLTVLDLSNNFLETLPHQIFCNLEQLLRLNISRNKLSSLDSRLFSSQINLVELHLSYNQLSYLNKDVLLPLNSIKDIKLYGNPFDCNCRILPVVMWCKRRKLNTEATCRKPSSLRHTPWTALSDSALNCPSIRISYSSVSVLLMCLCLIVICVCFIAIFYCWRKRNSHNIAPVTSREINVNNTRTNDGHEYVNFPTWKCRLSVIPEHSENLSQAPSMNQEELDNSSVFYEEITDERTDASFGRMSYSHVKQPHNLTVTKDETKSANKVSNEPHHIGSSYYKEEKDNSSVTCEETKPLSPIKAANAAEPSSSEITIGDTHSGSVLPSEDMFNKAQKKSVCSPKETDCDSEIMVENSIYAVPQISGKLHSEVNVRNSDSEVMEENTIYAVPQISDNLLSKVNIRNSLYRL